MVLTKIIHKNKISNIETCKNLRFRNNINKQAVKKKYTIAKE